MKIRSIPQCKLLIQAKQSKISQGTEQLKVPETSQTTIEHNFKVKAKGNRYQPVNTNKLSVQCTRLKACEPSNLQNKWISHDKQANTTNLYWSHWIIVGQPENMNSNVSNRTTRTSLGSKGNEKVKTANDKCPKSCSNNQETNPIGFMFISCIIIIS
jgi:hypothetical protein